MVQALLTSSSAAPARPSRHQVRRTPPGIGVTPRMHHPSSPVSSPSYPPKAKADVTHTSCIVGRVPADETTSAAPAVAIRRPTLGLRQALEIGENAVPPTVHELATGGPLPQVSKYTPARCRGAEDRPDVVLVRNLRFDIPNADRAVLSRAALLRRRPPALRRAPAPRSPRPAWPLLRDGLTTARARAQSAADGNHGASFRPRVQVITVAARQRRCFPIRIPLGP